MIARLAVIVALLAATATPAVAERLITSLSNDRVMVTSNYAGNGFAYGLATAFMALATGWLASIVFRRD
jgi:hypothetical protein